MELVTQIYALLERHLDPERFFVVDVQVSPSKIRNKLTILLDSDEGIGIDDLTDISRAIETELDEIMPAAFTLEVSSPGLDTPLKFPRMYRKNINRTLSVTLNDGSKLKGQLVAADDAGIRLQPAKTKKQKETSEPLTIPYDDIKEAKVQVSFN